MMDAKLKADWVKALRSGEYEQCTGQLIDEKGAMCCIGVLAHVMGKDNGWLLSNRTYIGESLSAPGWPAGFPEVETIRPLASMNDGGVPFSEIADYIEKHL